MVYEKKQLLLAFVLAVLAGAGLHFVYGLSLIHISEPTRRS